jgi:hypothetical protein
MTTIANIMQQPKIISLSGSSVPKETYTYNLEAFTTVAFNGFEFTIPPETMDIITKLAVQVGSPSYIKTPTFHVRPNNANTGAQFGQTGSYGAMKKKSKHNQEISAADWESIRNFQATKIETRAGIDGMFDKLRIQFNKISDKNYNEIKTNIISLLDELAEDEVSPEDMTKIGNALFDIAANNRFYSKLYADLYAELIGRYEIMKEAFQNSFQSFSSQFENVECGDPEENYDEFCRINKVNECRRALSLFFVNLTHNGILTHSQLLGTLYTLMAQMVSLLNVAGKQNEVNELAEIISIIYSKSLVEKGCNSESDYRIDGASIEDTIKMIASSKPKTYASLSSKSKFKFMDILDKNV